MPSPHKKRLRTGTVRSRFFLRFGLPPGSAGGRLKITSANFIFIEVYHIADAVLPLYSTRNLFYRCAVRQGATEKAIPVNGLTRSLPF